jgi:hypothetical protein
VGSFAEGAEQPGHQLPLGRGAGGGGDGAVDEQHRESVHHRPARQRQLVGIAALALNPIRSSPQLLTVKRIAAR